MTRVTAMWFLLAAFLPFAETSAHIPKGYKYDAAQNLNVRTNNGATTTFSVNVKNELTGATYDANGNATSLNFNSFTYDAENRLVQIVGYNNTFRYDFTCDGFSRLRMRSTYAWNGSQWNFQSAIRYIYDGWTVIQERDYGGTPSVTYTRGPDLSGTLQGAGGIGGMLSRSHGYSAGNWSTHHAYHADAGGNITAMVNTSQTISATYRYDSFGNLLSQSGSMASANKYRFSSKESLPAFNLSYYGFRFYDPFYQRWINQDPIGEQGGINLYTAFANGPVFWIDPWGLKIEVDPNTSPEFRDKVNDCIKALERSAHGRKMLDQMRDHENTLTITDDKELFAGPGERYAPESYSDIDNFVEPPVIYLDVERRSGVSAEINDRGRAAGGNQTVPDSDVGCAAALAHELGHALGAEDERDKGSNIRRNENPVRRDLGLPLRSIDGNHRIPEPLIL